MAFVGNVTAAGNSAMPVAATLYGTCTTAAATQAKVVTCAAYDLATPITGMTIVIKFTNTNTYNGTITLNINSKGAKNAYRYGTTNIGTTVQTSWPAGAAVSFTFDGTNWILTDPNYDTNSNTTYSAGTGLALSSTTFNHSNSVTAGTAGTSSATSGSTLAVPYVTYDAQGHVTASGTHTHTVSGFAASNHTHSYLPLSGGTLTGALSGTSTTMSGAITAGGNITFGNGTTATLIAKTPSRTDGILWVGGGKKTAGDANGTAVRLQGGGLMMVGSGEYTTNRYNLADLNDGDETLFLGSDGAVYVETNGQTIANRKTFTFGADGTFNSPSTIKQNGSAVALASAAISNITRSGTTFTATRADGTTFTFTQQDSNTTYTAGTGLSLSSNKFSVSTIPIANGGTGQTTRVAGMNALSNIGSNAITSTTNDTTAKWGAFGNGVSFYSATGQLTDQPTQYGYLINISPSANSEVHQIWTTQASGNMYHRGGNSAGWSGTWRKVLDSANTTISTATIKKPTAGTAIAADDITAWTTNTPTVVTKKTVVTAASGATAAISNGLLTLTNGSFTTGDSCTVTAGTAASLSYTARSIPNISLSDQTVVTGVTIS